MIVIVVIYKSKYLLKQMEWSKMDTMYKMYIYNDTIYIPNRMFTEKFIVPGKIRRKELFQ